MTGKISLEDRLSSALAGDSLALTWLAEALGPDGVPDWFSGGRERWGKDIAQMLRDGRYEALGKFFSKQVEEYANE
jgi:hypothetical protein